MADDVETPEITDALKKSFKARMHITTSHEDDYLTELLKQSAVAVMNITNDKDLSDQHTIELVFERARYAYNDQLEFFDANFGSMLLERSIENLPDPPSNDNEVVDDGKL
ncbi:phage gp6-like head-tail connector protein [Lacticaseibacillus rhamnosus]|uniref:phage gp6-like head-tail connector protein n=1 Tax=Lacticaseibacillus rhamnosus TaxID=47715 RepID=UPI00237FA6A0|nr:phage gp6-like head-tail connector protein [Lacticaseibacillus rhamnosus]MDE3295906.1 phage gp6-like head-tail connector protein [Lacticaseibacillus rhamnosus]